jgi:two-component system, OmpR family, sensor histidine kinase KdpD
MERPDIDLRRLTVVGAAVVAALAGLTVVVAVLESRVGVPDASAAYLLAVVAIAVAFGTTPAVLTSVGAFLIYDYFFIEPKYTFTVRDPREWLTLLLLLVIGVVVGQLAGRQRDRAETALAGEREARALFGISFALAEQRDTLAALGSIAARLRDETRMSRVWITLGETVAADAREAGSTASLPATPAVHATLRRRPGDQPAEWVRVHSPARRPTQPAESAYRVAITAGDQTLGSLWASRPRAMGDPDGGETRVLAAAADQIAGSLERDRLQREATSAEVSRRSDVLKSALLDSVSHDLRTPLASVRAAAGMLMDPDVDWPPDKRREIAASIDREAQWLNRLVTNLLDMSRVEAGELRPTLAAHALPDLVSEAVTRTGVASAGRVVTVEVPPELPPVLVDEVFMGQILANIIDNAAKYAGPDAPIRISASVVPNGRVKVTIEDGGLGVPDEYLPRLFEKFYRVPRKGEGSRRGTGIGLAVVRGLIEAMGGDVVARRSPLGGLAVDFDVPIAASRSPAEEGT